MGIYERISKIVPTGELKEKLRSLFYRAVYSFNFGTKKVIIKDHVYGEFSRFPLIDESENKTEIEGYMKYYNLKKGNFVIDAGAFHGYFAVYAAKIVGDSGKGVCFEPDKKSFRILSKNIQLNKLKNVILINKGLWSKNTTISFKSAGERSTIDFTNKSSEKIEVTRLDDELKKIGIKKIDFIKMDIEGAETEALLGAKKTLAENDVNLAIASYHLINGKKTARKVEEILRELDYFAFTNYPIHLTTYAFRK